MYTPSLEKLASIGRGEFWATVSGAFVRDAVGANGPAETVNQCLRAVVGTLNDWPIRVAIHYDEVRDAPVCEEVPTNALKRVNRLYGWVWRTARLRWGHPIAIIARLAAVADVRCDARPEDRIFSTSSDRSNTLVGGVQSGQYTRLERSRHK
eukprot:gene2918-3371_t